MKTLNIELQLSDEQDKVVVRADGESTIIQNSNTDELGDRTKEELGQVVDWFIKNMDKHPDETKCVRCGTRKNISYTLDPYEEDVEQRKVYIWACQPCQDEIALEI